MQQLREHVDSDASSAFNRWKLLILFFAVILGIEDVVADQNPQFGANFMYAAMIRKLVLLLLLLLLFWFIVLLNV